MAADRARFPALLRALARSHPSAAPAASAASPAASTRPQARAYSSRPRVRKLAYESAPPSPPQQQQQQQRQAARRHDDPHAPHEPAARPPPRMHAGGRPSTRRAPSRSTAPRNSPDGTEYVGPMASEAVQPGSVHVVVKPRPRTLSESVEVLQQLQAFGEVVMFRNMKYEASAPAPHRALAIFRSPDAAARAIAASPLRFVLGARRDETHERRPRHDAVPLGDTFERAEADAVDAEAARDVAAAEAEPDAEAVPESAASAPRPFVGEVVPPWVLHQETEAAAAAVAKPRSEARDHPPASGPPLHPVSLESSSGGDVLTALLDPGCALAIRPPQAPSPLPAPAAAPWYRHSPGRHELGSGAVPDFYAAPPREAVAHVNASGLAVRFYNLRQPYFSTFAANSRVYPGSAVLGPLPPGLQGVANADYTQNELGPSIRGRRERARAAADRLGGKSLRALVEEGRAWRVLEGVVPEGLGASRDLAEDAERGGSAARPVEKE